MTASILLHAWPALESSRKSQEAQTIIGLPVRDADGEKKAPAVVLAPEASRGPESVRRRAAIARLRTSRSFIKGDRIAERYRLDRRLADGGMGGVWAATDIESGREVVVKLMSVELRNDDDAVKRFAQEADAVASVQSPHIVEFIDYGVIDGAPYIVLERLRGEDLAQRLHRGRLPLEECARLLEQMAHALLAAHGKGIIHRDIKPANIFLAHAESGEDDAPDVVKLLDFGIAKLQTQARIRTKAGITIGSPHYMSPEQVQGEPHLDGRSDLFALGAVIYTCVTGRMPFDGTDLSQTFQRILRAQFEAPSKVIPELPETLDDFFLKALALDPNDRWPTADALASAFRAAVEAARGHSTMKTASRAPAARDTDPPAAVRGSARPAATRASDRPAAARASDRPTFPEGAPPPKVPDAPRPIAPRPSSAAPAADTAPRMADPRAFEAFGAATRMELRAHLVAPLAKPKEVDAVSALPVRSLVFATAALLSLVVAAGALWRWSTEPTGDDRARSSEAGGTPVLGVTSTKK